MGGLKVCKDNFQSFFAELRKAYLNVGAIINRPKFDRGNARALARSNREPFCFKRISYNKEEKIMLKEKLLEDLKECMKEKNVTRKNVVQMVRAAVLQVEKDKQIEVTDEQIVEIIAKEAKKRKDSIPDYEKSGRQDLLDQIREEITILEEYLPEQLSAEEIEAKVKEIIAELGASSMKEMGMVMKAAKEKLGATADGKTINEVAKKLLS